MANEEQTEILGEDGVQAWNAWRAENPSSAIDLSGFNMEGGYLRNANLRNAILTGAKLNHADLRGADLRGADLSDSDLQQCNFEGALLNNSVFDGARCHKSNFAASNADAASFKEALLYEAIFANASVLDTNFRGASLNASKFNGAQANIRTRGLGRLAKDQFSGLSMLETSAGAEDQSGNIALETASMTVKKAKISIGPAKAVLDHLDIPNSLSEQDRDLFVAFKNSVDELDKRLTAVEDDEATIGKQEPIIVQVSESIPLWKQTFLALVTGLASSAATQGSSYAAGYTAGYIAGFLHDTFTASSTCLT